MSVVELESGILALPGSFLEGVFYYAVMFPVLSWLSTRAHLRNNYLAILWDPDSPRSAFC